MPLEIEYYALTDTGIRRRHNEDAYDIAPDSGLYVVADGMGGHASGQVASRLAVSHIKRYVVDLSRRPGHEFTFPVRPGSTNEERLLSNAIQWANERVFIESMKDRRYDGMGTTVVAVLRAGNRLVLGHVGDSRVYRFRENELEQLTQDDSLLNHYIQMGRLQTREEIDAFQEKNIIVKALGLKDYVEPSISSTGQRTGDIYLLCTDGLTDQLDDTAIAQILRDHEDSLQDACDTYIRLANEAGGKDNCSVMLLRVTGTSDSSRRMRDTAPNIPVVVTFEDDDEPTESGSDESVEMRREVPHDPSELPTIRRPSTGGVSTRAVTPSIDTLPEIPSLAGIEQSSVPRLGELDDSEYRFEDRIDDPNET
ncbi:MAG: Stp1/IreP family PP2C-type Ser/Thr phosphatase [Myxococcota bacterium]|nr:Stp1/IreP family PP2C-type Ser/Thr phosphatase [Myxococcota bacterium]